MLSRCMLSRRHGHRLAQRSLARQLHLNHKVYPGPAETKEPPLLILHGLFGSASNFRGPAQQLSKQREVVLADLRNHGASPWDDDVSFSAAADDVAELVESLGVPSANLVGHSLGGKVAMTAALLAPERVSRLLVVDIAPVQYDDSHESWRANLFIMDTMAALPEAALASRPDADAALAAAIDDVGVRGFLLQNLVPKKRPRDLLRVLFFEQNIDMLGYLYAKKGLPTLYVEVFLNSNGASDLICPTLYSNLAVGPLYGN